MNTKRGASKAVSFSKRKPKAITNANLRALDKLGTKPTATQLKNAADNVALTELEERVADVRDSWETDSLFEDAFEELSAESPGTDAGECSHLLYFGARFPLVLSSPWIGRVTPVPSRDVIALDATFIP